MLNLKQGYTVTPFKQIFIVDLFQPFKHHYTMEKKITLANADKQKTAKRKGEPSALKDTKKNRETQRLIATGAVVEVTESDKAQPLHSLVGKYQHEAIKTLVHLMRSASSETVRKQCASEILALGGNSSDMLKLQAVMTGKNKDVSQMSVDELESFVQNAKYTLDSKIDFAANSATVVTETTSNSGLQGVGGAHKDSLKSNDSPDDTWL